MTSLLDIKSEFPALTQKIYGHPLTYLDSAASTLKPKKVIERITHFYSFEATNVHRGAHYLSRKATDAFEASRESVKTFLNANSSDEIIFTKGTTESINLVAASYGSLLNEGDEILISAMEHHSNIVPWQMLAEKKKLVLKIIPLHKTGEIDLEAFEKLLSEKTKILSIVWISNTLGLTNPIEAMIKKAKALSANVVVLVDAAQSVSHLPIDVQKLNCDFLAFSAHKLFGPTGIGVLFGKKELLEKMPPYQGGGSMIADVSYTSTTYNEPPFKFEAGTPHVAGVIALQTAIEFVNEIGLDSIEAHHKELSREVLNYFSQDKDLVLYGTEENHLSIFSFNMKGVHASDIGSLVDHEGVAIRVGHHCTQPLWPHFDTNAAARASFSIYNDFNDLERFVSAIQKVKDIAL